MSYTVGSPPSLLTGYKSLRHQEDQLIYPSLQFSLLLKPTLQVLGPELGSDIGWLAGTVGRRKG